MRLVVDSSVWIDYFNGRPTPQSLRLKEILGAHDILVGDVILAEVLQGFRVDTDFQRALRLLERFEWVSMLNPEQAIDVARHYRRLRTLGVTQGQTVDLIIGGYCINAGCPLLYSDRGFDPMVKHLGLMAFPQQP